MTAITITGMDDDFPAALNLLPAPLTDGSRVLACIHATTPGTKEIAYAAVYLVSPLTWVAERVVRSEAGKAIACSVVVVDALNVADVMLELWVTEPPVGGGGAESAVHLYRVPIGKRMMARDGIARQQAQLALDQIAELAAMP